MTENMVKPLFLLQNNWYKMMEYGQTDMTSYFYINSPFPVHQFSFQYIPKKEEDKAALSFHLTRREKRDIALSLSSMSNRISFEKVLSMMELPKGKLTGRRD
jgi:hypothetical protein